MTKASNKLVRPPPLHGTSSPPPSYRLLSLCYPVLPHARRMLVCFRGLGGQDSGVLRADEFAALDWESNPSKAQLSDVLRVHDYAYVEKLGGL